MSQYDDELYRKKHLCPCGSGMIKEKEVDGYGIFLCYVCPSCRTEKLATYRPDIFTRYECDEPIEED